MNSRNEDKLSMYIKVRTFLQIHGGKLTATPYMAVLQTEYNLLLDELIAANSLSQTSTSGYTATKQNKRTALRNQTLNISRALSIYFSNNNLLEELAKAKVVKTDWDRMRDSDFYTNVYGVLQLASPHKTELADFGITPVYYNDFALAAQNFLEYLQIPKEKIGEKTASTAKVEDYIIKIDNLLYDKMDMQMGFYEFSDPYIYSMYLSSRNIDNTNKAVAADYEGIAKAGEITIIDTIDYLASRSFEVENKTTGTLFKFGLSENNTGMEGTPMEVKGGETHTRLSSNLGLRGNYILLHNNGPVDGEFRIWIEE